MAEKDISARLRRAVKENNLFLVKRLSERTDIRNPDPGLRRYTSLAWAAVLGHEETFEFLLQAGHDDAELSKDAEDNTILILLAEVQRTQANPYCRMSSHPDLLPAALHMAQLYTERYPFILEWSNVQGKTALHVAAMKGNEGLVRMFCEQGADLNLTDNLGNTPLHYASAWNHVQIIQILIEGNCNYTCRNHDGFTASDYAYSYNTMSVLQETARMQYEHRKHARRQIQQLTAARSQEWIGSDGTTRLRSGSGGSRTTATSDSGDVGFSPMGLSQQSSSFTSSSSQMMSFTGSSSRLPLPRASPSLSHSSSFTIASPLPATISPSISSLNLPQVNSVLKPVATRVREQDADAIAEYKKRNRSGSSGTQYSDTKSQTSIPSMSTLPTINGSSSHLPLTPASSSIPPSALANRRLRPSASAAQLRSTPPGPIATPLADGPRIRSGTQPTGSRPNQLVTSPTESTFSVNRDSAGRPVEQQASSRRAGTAPNRDGGDFTGPPSEYAFFPDPPTNPLVPAPPNKPASRRTGFALLSKPLPSLELKTQRDHRRLGSASEVRS